MLYLNYHIHVSLRKHLPISRNHPKVPGAIPEDVYLNDFDNILGGVENIALSEDRMTAIANMAAVEEIYKSLPHLDCGSCGAPNCHALAEDVIKGEAKKEDCLIRQKGVRF